ncbi:MAG: ankyrin repeat domain-containing protein [Sphingobacterium sp.]|uniref:ankyrin repeat domain-containing protein n=1 Tax=Sphingobacterium sp. TaxID=341027 RepID=UPI0028411129|nr:ankyrin repeat domain-containing protein [Sphingobacterium sp.]MDR3007454.1 ankyrin repeat domain-containing protein [Sphingobacterium sp.]
MSEFDINVFMDITYKRDEKLLVEYLQSITSKPPEHQVTNVLKQIIQNKYWEAFELYLNKDWIQTDLFEYESFNHSPIAVFLKPALYDPAAIQAYLPYFNKFLSKIEDINEEVSGDTLLSFAIDNNAPIEILKALIDAGININFKSRYGESYLYLFCQKLGMPPANADQIIQLLLDNEVDVNATTIENKTALFLAVSANKIAVCKQLLENGADVNITNTKGETPFLLAAAHSQNIDMLKLLLEYGTPDFTQLTKDGENLLNVTLRFVQRDEHSINIIGLLLENGASLSATSQYYQKPKSGIDWVAEKSSELLSYLLEHHYIEDINEADNDGNTLLIKVCMYNCNYEESVAKDIYRKVKLLLKHGADSTIENRFDKKAVDYAMEDQLKTKIVETLLA